MGDINVPALHRTFVYHPHFTLVVHPTDGVNEETLKKIQNELPDEFGVITENILYNIEDDKVFCLIEAPSKSAVGKHHARHGIKCEWIIEVKTTSTKQKG
jgi:hypothetical protein